MRAPTQRAIRNFDCCLESRIAVSCASLGGARVAVHDKRSSSAKSRASAAMERRSGSSSSSRRRVGGGGGGGDDDVKAQALQLLESAERLPQVVVFDLDYTLWPFWCECMSKRDNPYLYPQVAGILDALREKGVAMAVASRTPTPDIAAAFLAKLDLTNLFSPKEIYPSWSHKTEHFQKIQQKSNVPFKSMLFFDDEHRNIKAVAQMGVTSIFVDNGVNLKALQQGLHDLQKK